MKKEFQTECFIKSVSVFSKDERMHIEFEPSKEWSVEFEKKRYFILKETTDGDDSQLSPIVAILLEKFTDDLDPASFCLAFCLAQAKMNKSRIQITVEGTVPAGTKSCWMFSITNITLI